MLFDNNHLQTILFAIFFIFIHLSLILSFELYIITNVDVSGNGPRFNPELHSTNGVQNPKIPSSSSISHSFPIQHHRPSKPKLSTNSTESLQIYRHGNRIYSKWRNINIQS